MMNEKKKEIQIEETISGNLSGLFSAPHIEVKSINIPHTIYEFHLNGKMKEKKNPNEVCVKCCS